MAETSPLLPPSGLDIPLPTFTYAVETKEGKRPQAIAHRGYKAAFPENTIGAFKGAAAVGAHAIETDIHLSKDGVVVLSHDATLKRCFGKDEKIIDCDWDYLQTLRTLKAPAQPMPRLRDLLEYLATPGLEDIWVLLDIKLDNSLDTVFKLIAEDLDAVTPAPSRPWNQRVVLGCWAANQLSHCVKDLPGYPITHIGFNIVYARQFLKVPGVGFNMFQKIMVGPMGTSFLKQVQKAGRSLFLWTVNDEEWMKWSIKKGVDGVITDDPKKYLEVSKNYDGSRIRVPASQWGMVLFYNTFVIFFSLIFRLRHGFSVDVKKIALGLEEAKLRR